MLSATVCRSASREDCAAAAPVADEPSLDSTSPSRSWSIPRPKAGIVVVAPPLVTTQALSGPKPWPTTLVPIVARNTALVELVKPWPNPATGHPPAGGVPGGRTATKGSRSASTGRGPPSPVGVCGMVTSGVSQDGAWKLPNTIVPPTAAVGTGVGDGGGSVAPRSVAQATVVPAAGKAPWTWRPGRLMPTARNA